MESQNLSCLRRRPNAAAVVAAMPRAALGALAVGAGGAGGSPG
jgi:hypothetical protein